MLKDEPNLYNEIDENSERASSNFHRELVSYYSFELALTSFRQTSEVANWKSSKNT